MDQTWCPVCPVAVKGELLHCNEATAEQGLSLTIQDWEELQAKLFALLARQVRNYTQGESDSVPVETAQALLDSICFTLGLDLEDPGERGRELLARDLAKELTSRRERLRGEMVRGNILWVSLCRALPPVKNRAMQDTLRSIGGFWRRYDFVYLAQEIPCDIDYQLALPVSERMQGVRYVKEYLRRLSIENHFLRRYTWADLVPVLERYHPWYQEEVCNLFLPVAVNALGKALLGAAPVPLTMTEGEREALAQRFRDQTKETVFAQLAAAARSVAGKEENTAAYLTACAEDLAGRLFALEGSGTVWL